MKKESKTINNLLEFIERSPTPFHAVHEMACYLSGKGFIEIKEADAWDLVPNSRYFLTRNDSSLIAFAVGSKSNEGFKIIGAHTDSPNLRLKPHAGYAKSGYLQLGYEGGLVTEKI